MGSLSKDMARDYVTLQQALMNRFSPEGRESYYTVQLWNRTCQKGEKVAEFGYALKKLAKIAYPGVSLHEQLLVDLFIKGLPTREMRKHLHLARPSTLEKAINLATTVEVFEPNTDNDKTRKPKTENVSQVGTQKGRKANASKHAEVNIVGNQPGLPDTLKPDRALIELLEAMQRRLEKLEQTEGTKEPFKPTPNQGMTGQNSSGPNGQFSRQDYNRSSNQRNPTPYQGNRPTYGQQGGQPTRPYGGQTQPGQSNSNGPNLNRTPPICYFCGQPGHFRRECPLWIGNQGRNNAPPMPQMPLN
jgi:hypothetical protein